jgi:hypothetical protein
MEALMNKDVTKLRADNAAAQMRRVIKQELFEMARYQPLRFHDFTEAMKTLHRTAIEPEDMDDDTYDAWHATHFLIGVLGTIKPQRLKPKAA